MLTVILRSSARVTVRFELPSTIEAVVKVQCQILRCLSRVDHRRHLRARGATVVLILTSSPLQVNENYSRVLSFPITYLFVINEASCLNIDRT